MNYTALFKKAYRIVIKNKFLWIFGFLLGGSAGLNSFGNSGSGYRGDSSKNEQVISQVSNFISHYWLMILILILILLAIMIIFSILSIISRGAIIGSVKKIADNKKAGIRDGFSIGWHSFWRILGVSILLFLIVFVPIFVLILLMILLVFIPIIGWIIDIFLFLLLIAIAIVGSFIIGVVSQMSYCYCVIDKKSIIESLKEGWTLFKNCWKNLLIVFLLLMLISIIVGIALFITILLIGIPLVLIGVGIYYAAGLISTIIYSTLFGLLVLIGLAVFSGAINSYTETVWTLAFLNLTNRLEIEEA